MTKKVTLREYAFVKRAFFYASRLAIIKKRHFCMVGFVNFIEMFRHLKKGR